MTLRRLALLLLAASASVSVASASADLKLKIETPAVVARASRQFTYFVTATNLGPDQAVDVAIATTLDGAPGDCHNVFPTPLPADQQQNLYCTGIAPSTEGILTIGATVTSATPDENPANNSATATIAVSTGPDLSLGLEVGPNVEPGLPFNLTVRYLNSGGGPASNAKISVWLPPSVSIKSLPTGCTVDFATRVTCDVGTVPLWVPYQEPLKVTITLLAPDTLGGGILSFGAEISSSGFDLAPSDNIAGRSATLFRTFVVDSPADDGPGSLRQALTDANAQCSSGPCEVQFRFTAVTDHATIRTKTPLPVITANNLLIDGATQTRWSGDTNQAGPEVEINGSEQREGDGLVVASACDSRILALALNGFPGSALRLRASHACDPVTTGYYNQRTVASNYIGVDPSGTTAVPNLRGITIEGGAAYLVEKNVISGNLRSALFVQGPNTFIRGNIIGLNAAGNAPLGNGASGIFVSKDATNTDISDNAIAFNHEFGIAIERGTRLTEIHGNSIHANWQPGIDIGLDGATAATDDPAAPSDLTAHYDPQTDTTIIEGTSTHAEGTFPPIIRLFANDAPDRSGFGQGQYYLGETRPLFTTGGHNFTFTWPGDLRGKFIAATATRVNYYGWLRVGDLKPEDSQQGFEKQTSEFSRTVEVK